MGRKSREQRLAEQAERQQKQRVKDLKAAKPSRDDVARMTLWWLISTAWRRDPQAREWLTDARDELTDLLVAQGFDAQACGDEIERLYVEYRTDTPPFRIKRHLKRNQPPEDLDI